MKYQINDIELNVCDQGLGEQVLFFLHYWGGSLRTWGEVIKRLENHFRCVAYDHRGWGNSDAPPSGYRIEDLAHDAEGLIRKLGLRRYALIGTRWAVKSLSYLHHGIRLVWKGCS